MKSEPAHGQEHVEDVILDVLQNGRIATTQEIYKAVKSRLELTSADLERAGKRPNESKIYQIIANALQDKRRLCRDALIKRSGIGKFCITEVGRKYLANHREQVASMRQMLDDMFPNASWD